MRAYLRRTFLIHLWTLAGLAFAMLAAQQIVLGNLAAAARWLLLVLLVDHTDGTLARRFRVAERIPEVSGGNPRPRDGRRRPHLRPDGVPLAGRRLPAGTGRAARRGGGGHLQPEVLDEGAVAPRGREPRGAAGFLLGLFVAPVLLALRVIQPGFRRVY